MMLLPKMFWRRFRCAGCGQVFELPLDNAGLPAHAPRWAADDTCDGTDAIPM